MLSFWRNRSDEVIRVVYQDCPESLLKRMVVILAGRPKKIRLTWYQEEPDFWDDPRFRSVRGMYGYLSFVIYKSLNDMMFLTNGYFLRFGTDREKADVMYWLQQRLTGPGLPNTEKIEKVICELVACGFFDGDLFRRGVITSRWAQECFYRSTVKRKDVFVDFDLWLLDRQDMESISTNSSVLSKYISSVNNGISDVNNSISDGSNTERKGKEITGEDRKREEIKRDKIKGDNRTGEDTPFLVSYRARFTELFGREPNPSHAKAVDNLHQNGKPAELILQALQSVEGKQIQDPEPYVYRVMKDYVPKPELPAEDKTSPDRPLEAWERDWLADIEKRRKQDVDELTRL